MRVSVIISTYNQPAWLEKVLWGYSAQTHRDFEVLIADDGSGLETRAAVERMRRETGLTIRHVWHEDLGFRKCAILNRAICEATGNYLIFTDGDCIPRRDFVAIHAAFAQPGYLLSGGAVRLSLKLSQQITRDDILSGRALDVRWLRAQGIPRSRKLWKLAAGTRWGAVCARLNPTRPTWNGGNASTWKSALVAVNGFNENMQYGGEDRELGERLVNFGVRAKCLRYRAVCVHLEHSRRYVSEDGVRRNLEIRKEIRRSGATWTPHGILKDAELCEAA